MEFSLENFDLVFQFGSSLVFVIKSSFHLHRNILVDCSSTPFATSHRFLNATRGINRKINSNSRLCETNLCLISTKPASDDEGEDDDDVVVSISAIKVHLQTKLFPLHVHSHAHAHAHAHTHTRPRCQRRYTTDSTRYPPLRRKEKKLN